MCLSCGTTALLPQMAFMALINPLIGLLLRCGCSSADFLEKRSVVVPFCVQGSAGVGLFQISAALCRSSVLLQWAAGCHCLLVTAGLICVVSEASSYL